MFFYKCINFSVWCVRNRRKPFMMAETCNDHHEVVCCDNGEENQVDVWAMKYCKSNGDPFWFLINNSWIQSNMVLTDASFFLLLESYNSECSFSCKINITQNQSYSRNQSFYTVCHFQDIYGIMVSQGPCLCLN